MVLRILTVRSIEVTDQTRGRITACTDLDQLETWGEKALTVQTAAELFT